MAFALELVSVHKRVAAGSGSCLASANVLRDVCLTVGRGEIVAIVGPPGSGKSTLLLCCAGLLRPDAGCVRWFGRARIPDDDAVLLHLVADRVGGGAERKKTSVHLIDRADATSRDAGFERWAVARATAGHTLIVAARDAASVGFAGRLYELRRGYLHPLQRFQARVAEPVCDRA